MFKIFTVVALLTSFQVMGQDDVLAIGMKTKEIVRLKLWYEGLESTGPIEAKTENSIETKSQMNEQLERPLNSIDI